MEFAVYTISKKGFFSKHFEIHQDDQLVYTVKKPSFFAFSEMIFFDLGGYEVQRIKKDFALFKSKFTITQEDQFVATFEKETIENYYTSDSIFGRHNVQGNFFSSEYTVFDDDGDIAKISRKRLRSTKKYGIAIIKGHDELYILALVIAIAMVIARKKQQG